MNAVTETRARLVGRNIVTRRKLLGMSQEQLATLIGKRRNHLSDWEQGKHEPRAVTLEAIAEALEVPVAFFYTDHAGENGAGQ